MAFALTYCYTTVGLVFAAAFIQRGYQDTWILQDVFLPTLLYVSSFIIMAVKVRDSRTLACLGSSFPVALNAIPNLKYQLFYGTFDSAGHYGFINSLLTLGNVPQKGFYAPWYGDNPLMHILVASLSLLLGISANDAIKLFTSVIYGVLPLMTYFATKGTFRNDVQKWIVVAASLPVVSPSYVLSGAVFGGTLYFVFLCVLLRMLVARRNVRRFSLFLLIIGYAIMLSHPATMAFLLLSLGAIMCVFVLNNLRTHEPLSDASRILGAFTVLAVSWMALEMFKARFMFEVLVETAKRILFVPSATAAIPQRFFEIPVLAQLEVLAVFHIKDVLFGLVSLLGLVILLKRRFCKESNYARVYLPLVAIETAMAFALILELLSGSGGFGELQYQRAIGYAAILQPFFFGFAIFQLHERLKKLGFRQVLIGFLLLLLVSASLIQVFSYQPLIPRANLLSKDLPEDEYIAETRMVNSLCQVSLISFADRYSNSHSRVTSDTVTRWQIYAFASESFGSRHIYYSALVPGIPAQVNWDIFLLHYDGSAGPLAEQVEYRTMVRVQNLKGTLGNVVYDAGGSFLIERTTLMSG